MGVLLETRFLSGLLPRERPRRLACLSCERPLASPLASPWVPLEQVAEALHQEVEENSRNLKVLQELEKRIQEELYS